ncbi:hypothetical protein ACIRD8_36050 [Streptomyces sp. NPDC102451]|uniref:hypothetical protein n=1 Tax=Streptomyces sp. NPDC102451 TaxID=3366177 RepID=UPI0038181437
MTEPTARRPGRPMPSSMADLAHQPPKVAELVLALRGLIVESQATLEKIAKETPGLTNRQALSRNIRRANGPDRHIVEAVVRHCSRALGEPEDARLPHFLTLWRTARAADPASKGPGVGKPKDRGAADPEEVAPVLLLVAQGHHRAAAASSSGTITTCHPCRCTFSMIVRYIWSASSRSP